MKGGIEVRTLVVLASWYRINGEFPDVLNGMYFGGKVRMEAAIKYNADKYILVAGTWQPKQMIDMKMYLMESGIAEDKIVELPSLHCTLHNMIALSEYLGNEDITILTNAYHNPRTRMFWYSISNKKVTFIAAESIVFPKIYVIPYIKRIVSEIYGIVQFLRGK
ncbi:MAG: ElyC/SanA/YdcF family protein, partial [Nanoarchaeota archaeon]